MSLGRRIKGKMGRKQKSQREEIRVTALLNVVVIVATAAVAFTDWIVVVNVSLGYLYVLPLALSALVNPLPFTIALAITCTILQDIFGPPVETIPLRIAHIALSLAGFLIVSFLVTLIARQRNRLAGEVRRQRDEYEHDLVLASQVQQRVLPQPLTLPGLQLAGVMRTARLLGGDYYDFFQLSDDVTDVVVADVSGKGVAASLLMPSLAVALRLRARELRRPAEIIEDLDRVLKEITNPATFVTVFYARFYRGNRTLEYANGGHNPPILIREKTGELFSLEEAGPIVGILGDAQFPNTVISLETGDILTFFTDGVTEQENTLGEEFSVERLRDVVCAKAMEPANVIADYVAESVAAYAGGCEQADDLSVIVMKLTV
jgi:serine phosphatase RsbU (regulator of sigma subunit)